MSFLIWTDEDDCQESLVALNDMYGCPYTLSNGYHMEIWGIKTKSVAGDEWGFFSPESRSGHDVDELYGELVEGFEEYDQKPDGWVSVEADDVKLENDN